MFFQSMTLIKLLGLCKIRCNVQEHGQQLMTILTEERKKERTTWINKTFNENPAKNPTIYLEGLWLDVSTSEWKWNGVNHCLFSPPIVNMG